MTRTIREFAWFLAGVSVLTLPLFLFATDSQAARFAKVTPAVSVVVLLVTALGLFATQRALDKLAAVAAGVAAAAAIVQLVQIGRATNLLGGNASTFSLLLALAVGWGGVALALRQAPEPIAVD